MEKFNPKEEFTCIKCGFTTYYLKLVKDFILEILCRTCGHQIDTKRTLDYEE